MLLRPGRKMVKKVKVELLVPHIGKKHRKDFEKNVLEPLAYADVVVNNGETQLQLWEMIYNVQRLRMYASGWEELPDQKKMKKWEKRITKMQDLIRDERSKLRHQFVQLNNELEVTGYNVRQAIKEKQKKRKKSSVYPEGVITLTKSLMVFWNTWTKKSHHITGYGYNLENEPDRKRFTVSVDPGEAFLQRVLKSYFNKPYTCYQIKSLVELAKKVEGFPEKMTEADYTWWENDPLWNKPLKDK